jgi:hypothetical protein
MESNSVFADFSNEIEVDGSRTTGLLKSCRDSLTARELIPMEAMTGWPLPTKRAGAAYITVPFTSGTRADGELLLNPPFAAITMRWSDGLIVAYRDLEYEALWPKPDGPVGTFPHPEVAGLTRREYLDMRSEALRMYDDLFVALGEGSRLSADWSGRFSELMGQLVEPPLRRYYSALGPAFAEQFLAAEASA